MIASCWLLAVATLLGGDGLWFGPAASADRPGAGGDVLVGGNAMIEIAVAPTAKPPPRAGGRAELAVYVANRGAQALAFGPSQLRLRTAEGELPIVPLERLVAELGQQAQRRRSDASEARSQAHASLPPTYYSGSLSNIGDYRPSRGGAGGYSDATAVNAADAARSAANRREIAVGSAAIDATAGQAVAAVEALALRQQDIAPGADAYGHVLFELPPRVAAPLPIMLTVDVGGAQFRFALLLRPAGD